MQRMNRLYGQINAERAKASLLNYSGALGNAAASGMGANPDDRSILDSIGDMFGSVMFSGGVPTGMTQSNDALNPTARQMLDSDQQKKIRQHYNEIDAILKQECIYCGPVLIDMIDNDIEGGLSGLEFSSNKQLLGNAE